MPIDHRALGARCSSVIVRSRKGACGVLASNLRGSGLAIEPRVDLSTPVADGASDPEATRSRSEVPPVAQGCDRQHARRPRPRARSVVRHRCARVGACWWGVGWCSRWILLVLASTTQSRHLCCFSPKPMRRPMWPTCANQTQPHSPVTFSTHGHTLRRWRGGHQQHAEPRHQPLRRDDGSATTASKQCSGLGVPLFGDPWTAPKHFAVWPLSEAAQACFGVLEWPATQPIPQTTIEFEVNRPPESEDWAWTPLCRRLGRMGRDASIIANVCSGLSSPW